MNDCFCADGDKEAIRLRMKNLRSKLTASFADAAGEQVLRRILELPEMCGSVPCGTVIGLYSPIRMELNLLSFSYLLHQKGMQIALPRVSEDTLVFSAQSDTDDLRPGMFGIMEPAPEAAAVDYQDLYAICLPGLAFDRTGARIGYGKGYYDRYLGQHTSGRCPLLIGTGYDFQLIDFVPQDIYDRRLDYIVTPSETIAAAVQT